MFVWEVATALACSLLRVNPFDPPDARGGSNGLLEIVEDLAADHEFPTYEAQSARQRLATLCGRRHPAPDFDAEFLPRRFVRFLSSPRQ